MREKYTEGERRERWMGREYERRRMTEDERERREESGEVVEK